MKRKMSMSFFLMGIFALSTIVGTFSAVYGLTYVLRYFSVMYLVSQLLSAANGLVPIALMVLLYVERRRPLSSEVIQRVLLVSACVKLCGAAMGLVNMVRSIGGYFIPLLLSAGPFVNLFVGLLLLYGYFSMKIGRVHPKMEMVLITAVGVCGFLMVIGIFTGYVSALYLLQILCLLFGVYYLPKTLLDYDNALMADSKSLVFMVYCIVLFGFVLLMGTLCFGGSKPASRSYYSSGYDYDKGYGYSAPKPGESASDYIKRQDPDLYDDLLDRYNNLS